MLTQPEVPNIISSPDDDWWKTIRKAATPAFSSNNLRLVFPHVLQLCNNICKALEAAGPNTPQDMDTWAQKLTLDVLGYFAFGHDQGGVSGDARGQALLHMAQQLMVAMQSSMNPMNRWCPWREEARTMRKWMRVYESYLEEEIARLRQDPPPAQCLMSHLMAVREPGTGAPIGPHRLKSELAIFAIAGYETTAHGIAWTLMFVATHPQVQERVAAELSCLGLAATPDRPVPRTLEWQDLGQLTYINAVIQESLRLMPTASGGTVRTTGQQGALINGHAIPPNTMVWFPLYAQQRSPANWPDAPDMFDPDRWLMQQRGAAASAAAKGSRQLRAAMQEQEEGCGDDDTSASASVDLDQASGVSNAPAWMPFSVGPRNCVGLSLALLEMRAALAMLCGRFTWALHESMGGREGVEADAVQHMTLKPGKKGLLLMATPRAAAATAPARQ